MTASLAIPRPVQRAIAKAVGIGLDVGVLVVDGLRANDQERKVEAVRAAYEQRDQQHKSAALVAIRRGDASTAEAHLSRAIRYGDAGAHHGTLADQHDETGRRSFLAARALLKILNGALDRLVSPPRPKAVRGEQLTLLSEVGP